MHEYNSQIATQCICISKSTLFSSVKERNPFVQLEFTSSKEPDREPDKRGKCRNYFYSKYFDLFYICPTFQQRTVGMLMQDWGNSSMYFNDFMKFRNAEYISQANLNKTILSESLCLVFYFSMWYVSNKVLLT